MSQTQGRTVSREPEGGLVATLSRCSESHTLILLLQDVDRAEQATYSWIERRVLPLLAQEQPKMLLLTTRQGEDVSSHDVPGEQTFRLSPFSMDQVRNHLQKQFGFAPDKAAEKAGSILAFSSGIPGPVHSGLEIERRSTMISEA